jgi:hypothetical protein
LKLHQPCAGSASTATNRSSVRWNGSKMAGTAARRTSYSNNGSGQTQRSPLPDARWLMITR